MATANIWNDPIADPQAVRDEWLGRLARLVDDVERWARQADWSTRRLDKTMDDVPPGRYKAPSLLFQREFTKILLDPISRFAIGTEGRVDLYLMPGYDDIAILFYENDRWWFIHEAPTVADAEPEPFTEAAFNAITDEMRRHDAELS